MYAMRLIHGAHLWQSGDSSSCVSNPSRLQCATRTGPSHIKAAHAHPRVQPTLEELNSERQRQKKQNQTVETRVPGTHAVPAR